MKVLILWTSWSGYMDACARELQRLLSCELDIVCLDCKDKNVSFARDEFFDYPCRPFTLTAQNFEHFRDQPYDLILVCGWHVKEYRALVRSSMGRSIRILCIDNQWVASARQYIGIVAFHAYLRRLYDFAFVPGNRQARFAGYLGFGPHQIIEGHYACADEFSLPIGEDRPRSFLFVGRLVSEKGIKELASAWQSYVERNANPWPLKVCGTGPDLTFLSKLPGLEFFGFTQPSRLSELMKQASVLVLPSLREPWGVVVHEAARAGLGLVLTTACGAADYFLRDGLNGRLVPTGDATALCDAFEWFHRFDDASLKRIRERSAFLGAQRTPVSWACAVSRALTLCHQATQ